MNVEVSELARKFAPWSISKVSLAEICPRQFKFKYVLKTETKQEVSDNKVGTCSHKILELRVGGTAAADAKKAALEETPLTSSERESLHVLEENMEDFLRRFADFCRKVRPKQILREQEWGFTADLKPCGFFAPEVFFRGKVDLGVVTADDDLIVIDHKSGMAKDIVRDQKFKKQLNSYAVLGLVNLPGMAGTRGGIHFMQGASEKRIQWLPYLDRHYIEGTLFRWIFEYINTCAEKFVEPFEARPRLRWPCEWCAYQQSCDPFKEMMRAAEV